MGDDQQAVQLSACHHRHFHCGDLGRVVRTAQGSHRWRIDMRLAAFQCPAVGRGEHFGHPVALGHVPGPRQIQAIARVVEHEQGRAITGQQPACRCHQDCARVLIGFCRLQHVGHCEQFLDLFTRIAGDEEVCEVSIAHRFGGTLQDDLQRKECDHAAGCRYGEKVVVFVGNDHRQDDRAQHQRMSDESRNMHFLQRFPVVGQLAFIRCFAICHRSGNLPLSGYAGQ